MGADHIRNSSWENPMSSVQIPLFVEKGADAPLPGLEFKERDAITAIVRDPKTGKYLVLRWKQIPWVTFVTGGIEDDQTAEEAARVEVLQETGYRHLRLVAELPRYDAKFYHGRKRVNRFAHFQCFLFELESDARYPVAENELEEHEPVWVDVRELEESILPDGHRYLFNHVRALGL
jgi:8-oxo-dGTP pyrophosphatase MutT (NUDIX family)